MLIKPLDAIQQKIRDLVLKHEVDLIVAVARGGIIPATMLQAKLGCELEWLWLNFRADDQTPIRERPELIRPLGFDPAGRSILVVDDRSTSGSTLRRAGELLTAAARVQTLVVNGKADYSLFDDECFYFPWRMDIPSGTPTEAEAPADDGGLPGVSSPNVLP